MNAAPSPILKSAEALAAKGKYKQIVEGLELDTAVSGVNDPQAVLGAIQDGAWCSPDPYRVCRDGERTEHLVRLAGMWVAERKALDRVTELALGWNSHNVPPLPEDKVRSTCASILKTHLRKHPPDNQHVPLTPLFDLATASVSVMLDTPAPPRRWLVEKLIPLGIVGMVVAPGASSKSMLALQLGLSVSCGIPIFGRAIPEPGHALLLCAEDDRDEIHRRIEAATNGLDPVLAQLVKQRLHIKSMVAENNLMTSAPPRGEVRRTDYVDRLILTLKDLTDLRLIVIDPASRFRGGDENAAQDATRFVEELERLRAATGATVIVLHHANKGSLNAEEQSQGASRGSSAMTDGVRWQMNLRKPTPTEATKNGITEERRQHFVMAAITKNNYGAPQEPIALYRGDHGVLQAWNGKATAHVDQLKLLVELVKNEEAAGNYYSADKLERKFGGVDGVLKLGVHKLRALIKTAVNQRYLDKKMKRLAVGPKRLV